MFSDLVAAGKSAADIEAELLSRLQLSVCKEHEGPVNGITLNEKDSIVYSVSDDHHILVYKYDNPSLEEFSMKLVESIDCHTEEVSGCSLDNTGTKLLSYGYDCKAFVTDVETGVPVWEYQTQDVITAGHISPNGQFIALAIKGGRDLVVLDAGITGVENATYTLPGFQSGKTILSTHWSPTTSRLVSCGTDNTARLFDLRSSKATLVLKGHSNAVSDAAFSMNEHWLATASWDKTVALWSLATGSFRTEGPSSFSRGHTSSVSSCSIKPDGSRIASGGYDKTVLVWETETGNVIGRLQGCTDWVTDVEITSTGNIVFASSRDGTLRALSVERAAESRLAACGRRALGITVVHCNTCGKPYSVGDTTELDETEMRYCVFCRLVRREKKKYLQDAMLENKKHSRSNSLSDGSRKLSIIKP